LPDAKDLVKIIKMAAADAVEATKPVYIYFGEVQQTSPLKINVEQRMILGEGQLVLSRNVTDYKTTVTVDWASETGKKEITIHNGLVVSDEVILIRQQGGQKFIVWDRIAT
jgi:hypothetical protein